MQTSQIGGHAAPSQLEQPQYSSPLNEPKSQLKHDTVRGGDDLIEHDLLLPRLSDLVLLVFFLFLEWSALFCLPGICLTAYDTIKP